MKRALLGLALLLVLSATASATLIPAVGDRLVYNGQTPGKHYTSGVGGGEFTFTLTKDINPNHNAFWEGTSETIYTFCAETDQWIVGTSYITGLSLSDSNLSNTVNDFGQWLFYRYANGGNPAVPTHTTLGYSTPNNITAGTLQWALWAAMQYGQPGKPSIPWADPNPTLYGNWLTAYANDSPWQNRDTSLIYVQIAWLGAYGVQPGTAQDQFVLITGGTLSDVPEPASLAIWAVAGGLGALGFGFKRRRGRWSDGNRKAIVDIVRGR